jgi:hypothetical protein
LWVGFKFSFCFGGGLLGFWGGGLGLGVEQVSL